MPLAAPRPTRAAPVVCVATLIAGWCVVAAVASQAPSQAPLPSAQAQPASSRPPLVIEAVVVDRNGQVVTDMRASDFQVTVDGWARGEVATALLFRGPGAAGLATAQWKANPGGLPPRVEPSRLVVLVADQGSFMPGDERRMQAVAENCLGLLGLGDRVMFVRLPDLSGTETASADREPVRQALRLVQPLRSRYELSAETSAAEQPPPPPVDSDPTVEAKPEEEAPTWRAALDLGDLLGGGAKQTTEPLTAPAVRAHAVEMLEGLRRLLVGLQPASVGSTILLLSAGLVATDAQPELDAVKTAAAAAFARIYAIQVPTPSARFASLGSANLMALARDTGGTLVTLHDKPAQALQRLAGELSFAYLLMPAPADDDGRLHSFSVATRRKEVTIRTGLATRAGRLLPEEVTLPSPTATGGEPRPIRSLGRRDPAVDAVVARVSDYVYNYGREVSAVVSEEVYEQSASLTLATAPGQNHQLPGTRRLVSDFLMVKLEGFDGWLPFRDVFEVDGVQVRDRDDRLRKLFLEAPPERAVENGNRILEESARYNIGNVRRNLNLPTLALFLVHPTNAARFAFSKRGEPTENGVRLWEIAFTEASRPTVIRTFDGKDIVSSGTFWVEPVSGRVVRSQLVAAGATITVTYEPRPEALGMWVPVRMQEGYVYPTGSISAIATYSKFRRFQVFTDTAVKAP